MPIGIVPIDTSRALPPLPEVPDDSRILYKDELEQMLFWNWTQPDATRKGPFRAVLQQVVTASIDRGLITQQFYDEVANAWTTENKKGGSALLVSDNVKSVITKITQFLLTAKELSLQKRKDTSLFVTDQQELGKLVDLCFASVLTDARINFVGFLCASYTDNFQSVSPTTETNRFTYFTETIRTFADAAQALNGNNRVTFLFADTDYEIYATPDNEENRGNYRAQYQQIRQFCREKELQGVRIVPWSRYRSAYRTIFDTRYEIASAAADSIQRADYAAQAATLPDNTVLLVMEPPQLNKSYDIVRSGEWRLPKLNIFDVEGYKQWTRKPNPLIE